MFGRISFFHTKNKNIHLKLLFWQLLILLPRLSVLHFFIFRHNRYLEKVEISVKKLKIFEYQPVFESFCFRNNIFKGFIWVVFHSFSKAQFCVSPFYSPLSISEQICRKFGEKSGILFATVLE